MNIYHSIIPIVIYCLSGICDAIMDTLSHHFDISIFKDKNQLFWNPSISWKNKYIDGDPKNGLVKWKILSIFVTKPVQLTDAWHFLKTIREIFNVLAITSAGLISFNYGILFLLGYIVVLGITRNNAFSLFYNKLLIKK
jgi:hypothetical protein